MAEQQEMMKAVLCERYGPPEVLRPALRPKPKPRDDQLLIRIDAAGVTASDIFLRSSQVPLRMLIPLRLFLGILRPRRPVIGLVFSGVVEAVGARIRRFGIGDEVYGLTGFGLGCYAEYTCLKETDSPWHGAVARRPKNVSHAESTAIAYGGLLALQRAEGRLRKGQRVLIYGASGTSGTVAVQYARHLGAQVSAVCGPHNQEFVRSLGADEVYDYTKTEVLPSGTRFDLVLDCVGIFKSSRLKEFLRREGLAPGGEFVSIDDDDLLLDSSRLDRLRELVEAGQLKPVLERTYALDEIVEAHHFVGEGHKRGGVAVLIDHPA